MKKNQYQRRVLGRIMAKEVEQQDLQRTCGAWMPTFSPGGDPTFFEGGYDTLGSPYVAHDGRAV